MRPGDGAGRRRKPGGPGVRSGPGRWPVPPPAYYKERFGARRVRAFGSLPTPWFRERSDIDLAVEGVPPERLGEAEAALAELAPDFRVDLVPLEALRDAPRLLRRIEEEGVDL